MIVKIWRALAQIISNNNDSITILKPFFKNLNNENINNKKYLPFLKSFPKYHLKVLYPKWNYFRKKTSN